MAQLFVLVALGISILFFVQTLIFQISKLATKTQNDSKLPPGKNGWPIIGETLKYVSCPEKFIRERMNMHSPEVFKTSLTCETMAVFCGPKANKFLFSNEGKLFSYWLPRSVAVALSYPKANNDNSPSGKPADELAYRFLRQESIQKYVSVVHSMVRQHVQKNWFPGEEIRVYTLAKEFIFALSCKVLIDASVDQVKDISKPFFLLLEGIFSVPSNFPGTPYYKALQGGRLVREKLVDIIKQRRSQISLNKNHYYDDGVNQQADLLTRLIVDYDKRGEFVSEEEIASKIIGLMFAGFYPTSTTVAFVISNLAQHNDVYERVLEEQMKIKKSKEPGDLLNWADLRKMKYTWNVICETMRLTSPVPGNFREAKTDFTYAGFTIPKGWKVHWTLHTTHKNPEFFQNPEEFDPSRFEGNGPAPYTYVPFGAGPRMCAGKEFARIEMLVILHNVVTKFRFIKVNVNEKIFYNPDPIPKEGLRVLLQSHET